MELIPSIDLRRGQAVRLYQGDFSAETPSHKTPLQLYRHFVTTGARSLHLVDLDGARDGVAGNHEIVRRLAKLTELRLQVGGGIRTLPDAVRILEAGAERIVAGSVAVEAPGELRDWIRRFGPEHIVAALDVRVDRDGTPRLATRGWQLCAEGELWDHAERLAEFGLRHVLCTDIARDGALAGPNVALYRECVRRVPSLAWQASGGVRSAADLHALAEAGVAAAICGRALIEERIALAEMVPFLPAA